MTRYTSEDINQHVPSKIIGVLSELVNSPPALKTSPPTDTVYDPSPEVQQMPSDSESEIVNRYLPATRLTVSWYCDCEEYEPIGFWATIF